MKALLKPLYILGVALTILWFVLKFLLNKGGYVHAILLGASALLIVQLVQDRRTRAPEFF